MIEWIKEYLRISDKYLRRYRKFIVDSVINVHFKHENIILYSNIFGHFESCELKDYYTLIRSTKNIDDINKVWFYYNKNINMLLSTIDLAEGKLVIDDATLYLNKVELTLLKSQIKSYNCNS